MDQRRAILERAQQVIDSPLASGGRSHNEPAISHCLSNSFIFLGVLEQRGCAHGRFCLTEGDMIGIDKPQVAESKVAHCASCCANVEGIARGDKHHHQTVGRSKRGLKLLRHWFLSWFRGTEKFCFWSELQL